MSTGVFKKGSIEMLTLLMLQEKDIYGYELIQMLDERSGGKLTVQEGSLYPLLYRLVEAGYVSGRDVVVETRHGRRRNRVLYHLEPSGRDRLLEVKAEYDQVQEGIRSVFRNSVPIGYQREDAYEQCSQSLSAGSEDAHSVPSFHEGAVPAPAGG